MTYRSLREVRKSTTGSRNQRTAILYENPSLYPQRISRLEAGTFNNSSVYHEPS